MIISNSYTGNCATLMSDGYHSRPHAPVAFRAV